MSRLPSPVLGSLTLLTYNTWALWWVNGQPRIFDGYLSEFSAADQPHNIFFRGGDLVTAVIVLILLARARDRRRRQPARGSKASAEVAPSLVRSRWETVSWLGLLLFGVSTFLDAFSSMDCSPTLDEACRVAEEAGRLSWQHSVHTWTSVGAQTGIVSSMVAGYLALRLGSPRAGRGPRARRLVLALSLVEVVALVVMMAMLVAGVPGLGYPQALTVLVASVWFALVGFDLAGAGTPSGPAAAEPPGAGTPTTARLAGRPGSS